MAARGGTPVTLRQALLLHQEGRLAEAEKAYAKLLRQTPNDAEVMHLLGVVSLDLGKPARAAELIGQCIKLNPGFAPAHASLADTLSELGRFAEALQAYDRAIALKLEVAEIHLNRGTVLDRLNRPEEALASYDSALRLRPNEADIHYNRATTLNVLGRSADALASFDRAIKLLPGHVGSHYNRACTLLAQQRYEAAIEGFDRTIALVPNHAGAFNNRGCALNDLKRYDAAIESYRYALILAPRDAVTHNNLGGALTELGRYDEAAASFENAYALAPDHDFLLGELVHAKMKICRWDRLAEHIDLLERKIQRGDRAASAFVALSIIDSPSLLKKAAEIYAPAGQPSPIAAAAPGNRAGSIIDKPERDNRIRLAYISADFHAHATAFLMAGLFECHDRTKFHVTALSVGPITQDAMQQRLRVGFDRFIDAANQSDTEIAALSRELGSDIAIDLKGFTTNSRPGIFAARAAPVQVSYLGFPGTMAVEYIDYLIADTVVITPADRPAYTESIVYLPHSYQVNDRTRVIGPAPISRAEAGLPDTGFVFCCFNNTYKITPDVFRSWMHILGKVEGSVLWLFEGHPAAVPNLRQAATLSGIAADRLVFAPRLPPADHLARHRLADVFLDTLPYNAHTTASDALWAGLPVLTRRGNSFAGRVAASLLIAAGLPDLITRSREAYETAAIELATDPAKLAAIRHRLAANLPKAPLFDTPLFTRHLEAAYEAMHARYRSGLPPEDMSIKATG